MPVYGGANMNAQKTDKRGMTMADYRQMWENLGMDLEMHDQLCEVLPVAFGDVYLSQKTRPEGMGYYNFVVSAIHGVRPAELIAH